MVVRTRRRTLIVVATVLALLAGAVAAGAAWWRWDTGRQPQVRAAVPAMTRAVADAVTAAGPSVVIAVGAVARSTDCRISPVRRGGIFTAGADLYTRPGEEEDVVTAMAQALARSYSVRRGVAVSGFRPLEADLTPGVRLSVRRLGQGRLGVSARTGCSLGSAPPPAGDPVDPAARAAVTTLFARLGTQPASFTTHRLPCAGGSISTVAAVSGPADTTDLSARLSAAVPASAGLFDPGDVNLVVYREGPVSVVIAASDDGTSITGQYTVAC